MIVFGAIAPHGNPVYEQPDGPTAQGMHVDGPLAVLLGHVHELDDGVGVGF